MALTPDEDIITRAVHTPKEGKKVPKWFGGKCSECGSITPRVFLASIRDGGLISGWHWTEDGKHPVYCDTVAGRFYAKHFRDTRWEWLSHAALDIALATGVVFYWDGEHFRKQSFVGAATIVTKQELAPAAIKKIKAFMKSGAV